MRKKFVAGNWKMFKNISEAKAFGEEFVLLEKPDEEKVEVAICAPFIQLSQLKQSFKGTSIKIGAQNVHFAKEGAYTGEISIDMLKELKVDYCIVGHSERREYFNETDESVNAKLRALLKDGEITPILCVGEALNIREAGEEKAFVEKQLMEDFKNIPKEDAKRVVIAYEPIWAIGTGKTATPEEADEMCRSIRDKLKELYDKSLGDEIIIQYGGSVKGSNASEILNMKDIDGALVGGASLKPDEFNSIINFK